MHPEDEYRPEREALRARVVERLNSGASHSEVTAELVEHGVPEEDAPRYLTELESLAEGQRLSAGELASAAAGGALAAIASGGAWAWFASGDARGRFLVIGIGMVTGWAVSRAALGARGRPLQVIALVACFAGIAFGKYALFASSVAEASGPDSTSTVAAVLSTETLSAFTSVLGDVVDGWDAILGGIALLIAWSMPAGIRLRNPAPSGPFG